MPFRLRYQQHDIELPAGRFVLGRSAECQLSLDDPLVSRKHALLVVADDWIEVQDLGSRNGVLVNGDRVEGTRRLDDGDRITIGSQDLSVTFCQAVARDTAVGRPLGDTGAQTVVSMQPVRTTPSVPRHVSDHEDTGSSGLQTTKADAFRLLGGVADKAFVLGRAEEAERLLTSLLEHVLQNVRAKVGVEPVLVEQASRYAAKLAAATSKAKWVDYVVELHTLVRRPCPAPTIDELHAVLRKVRDIDVPALRAYVQVLREASGSFGPAERFLVQRIEGLERLVSPQ
jgi:predicted component of type VI protein secretion system